MRLKTIIKTIPLTIASFFLMMGCNGAADGTSTDPDPDNPSNYNLSLSYYTVVDGQCDAETSQRVFDANERFCAVAKVTIDGSDLANVLVDFSSDNASMSPETTLTNDSGIAMSLVSSANQTAIAGTLTAIYAPASMDAVSDERTYEFTESSVLPPSETYTLTTSIEDATGVITRFKVDETVQLKAKFVDSANTAIADQLVTFQAGSASLQPATSLTDDTGVASVSYTPQSSELGANTLIASVTYQGDEISGSSVYEVRSADEIIPDGTIKMGHFDGDAFIEGQLGTSLTANDDGTYLISAGGTFGVTATLVTEDSNGDITRLTTPTSIDFTSDCAANDLASIDSPVTTFSGTASSTFSDISCSGNSQRDDIITATATVGNNTLAASFDFSLARQTLASLSFVSAEPTQIRIKGAGGTGSSESSLVTFLVTSSNGQPAAQQTVDFTLDTIVGGLSFSDGEISASSITNAQGLATIRVQSGTVPTPVRVNASATDADTSEVITSQSEQLTVNTGLPQQLGFSLSASVLNPEAGDYNGEEVTFTAYASDSFGNPTPDDTTINFTTEGGQIQPSCSTVNGRCSVVWTSASPRVSDHRITVMAYALGHETFFDTNGNNVFDGADGEVIEFACLDQDNQPLECTGNGMDIDTYHSNGFVDLPDAFRDDDESGERLDGEPYFNTAAADEYGEKDGRFNGPQCDADSTNLCGTEQAITTYIRKALVLTMSGSNAVITLTEQDGTPITDITTDISDIANEATSIFSVSLTDSANQMLPQGSAVSVTATEGTIGFDGFTIPNATREGGSNIVFTLENNAGPALSLVTVKVTTPKGVESTLIFSVNLL